MRIRTYISVIALLLLPQLAHAVTVGSRIDNFSLPDLNGTTHTPADYLGKVLVLAVIGYN